MKLRASVLSILCLVATLAAFAVPAHAQATRTWVSGVGDDANPCSRTAPCKTFAGAISKTAAGGEINCIDAGGFGAVTIVKAITIDCANVEAGVVVAGTNGVIVNAGAADKVVLRGIDFMGTLSVPGLNGIRFIAGNSLSVEKCLIREFTSAAPNGNGILFEPTGTSSLTVTDTVITNSSAAAISVRPTGAGSAKATLVRTIAATNATGFLVDASATSGNAVLFIGDSTATTNTTGVSAISTGASGKATINLTNSYSVLNTNGVSANGARSTVIAGGSTIWTNDNGLVTSGGTILSYGTNQMGNTNPGAFTPPVFSLQ